MAWQVAVKQFAIRVAVAALAMSSSVVPVARGDTFIFSSGGQVRGEVVRTGAIQQAVTELKTTSGIRLRFSEQQLQARISQPKADDEYERLAPMFSSSLDDQWRLSQWCLENNLPERRRVHLEAIIALETNHAGARRALGYQQFRGQWQTREHFHRRDGYELYRGRWRLSQDIEVQEEQAKLDLVNKEWLARLKRWRADLTSERAAVAWQNFEQLDDPAAIPALRFLLTRELDRRLKIMYLDALLRMPQGSGVQALVAVTLADYDEEIFYEGADRLKKLPPELIIPSLLTALKDASNSQLNRAAYVLGRTKDQSVCSPLIDRLISVQRVVNRQGRGDTTSFGSDGSIGMQRGGTTVTDIPAPNRSVHEALVNLTGQDFGYDQHAWRRWYNIEKARIFAKSNDYELRRQDSSPLPR